MLSASTIQHATPAQCGEDFSMKAVLTMVSLGRITDHAYNFMKCSPEALASITIVITHR